MGIEVCLAPNCIVAASAGCFKVPTLMQKFLESMSTGPWRGRVRLKRRSAVSTITQLGFRTIFLVPRFTQTLNILHLVREETTYDKWRLWTSVESADYTTIVCQDPLDMIVLIAYHIAFTVWCSITLIKAGSIWIHFERRRKWTAQLLGNKR